MNEEIIDKHTIANDIHDAFITYLVNNDIRDDNGLKPLSDLIAEYPQEWDNWLGEITEQ